MSDQLGLFTGRVDPPMPGYAPGSDTSREAAERTRPCVSDLHHRIIRYLTRRQFDGSTVFENMVAFGITKKDRIAPRYSELYKAGKIFKNGRRPVSRGSRSMATVWVLPEFATEERA